MPALPFNEVLVHLLSQQVMPTSLTHKQLSALPSAMRRASFYSAQTMLEDYLQEAQVAVESLINPKEDLEGVTVGLTPATAREELRNTIRRLGYRPGATDKGIQDLSSDARINLVTRTNTEMAQGAGRWIRQNDPAEIDDYPALELYRASQSMEPRDWSTRWALAASRSGDRAAYDALMRHGVMAALNSSPIWQALGDGAGGYRDSLGNPYPPFAFNSNMRTRGVEREQAEALGLISPEAKAQIPAFDFESLVTRTLTA
jgi:hypothetical protein